MVVRRSALQRSGDKNAPQALFKPICVQYGFVFGRQPKNKFVSSAAGRPGFQGAALNRFCILLSAQKDAPAGQACLLKPCKRPAPPEVTTIFFTNIPAVAVQTIISIKLASPEAIANYVMSICRRAIAAPPAGGKEAGTS